MTITIHTKGQFNYRNIYVSDTALEALRERGYIKEVDGLRGKTYSIEAKTDRELRELLNLSGRV